MKYKCFKTIMVPPPNFIPYNCCEGYKTDIEVDACLEIEIRELWNRGIRTTGCCCGHGKYLGFIQVVEEDIPKMLKLGYQNYIYDTRYGGVDRKDAFIPLTTHHLYEELEEDYRYGKRV